MELKQYETCMYFSVYGNYQMSHNKKGLPLRIALSLNGSLAMCYSRMGRPQTTIAANVFHF
jgi:hypothetical protein